MASFFSKEHLYLAIGVVWSYVFFWHLAKKTKVGRRLSRISRPIDLWLAAMMMTFLWPFHLIPFVTLYLREDRGNPPRSEQPPA